MKKKLHNRILRGEPKEQHLSTVLKSCSYINISGMKHTHNWIHIYSHTTHINGKRKERQISIRSQL